MNYRPEIDGLRTIAVIPVLFFHFGINSFSGGFTGVDIFFVISGFLITSIITHEMDNQKFSFANFYRRRALRILPPLALVVVATFIAAWFLMLPAEVEELGRTTIATTLFGSNIYFFKAYNYFSILAESNPLLHTWSLAVEEQFYFVTPILLWLICFIKPLAKFRAHIIAFCVAVSFMLSLWLINWSSEAAFYLLPARFWELGIGSLIALYAWDKNFPGKLKNTAGIIGVGLLAYSIFMLDKTDMFPGLNAIYAIVGTALIIVAGLKSWTGLVLSQKPMVFIGKISYSLYLWHWPVLIFYKLFFLKTELNTLDAVILTAVSIVLAYLSWKYWEQPFRNLRKLSSFRILSFTSAGLIASVVVGMGVLTIDGRWRTFDARVHELTELSLNYTGSQVYTNQFRPRHQSCFVTDSSKAEFNKTSLEECLTSKTDNPSLVLIGDSHSAHLTGPLQQHLPEYEILPLQASGCKPLWPLQGDTRCNDIIRKGVVEYLPTIDNPTVMISAQWAAFAHGTDTNFERDLLAFIQKLYDAGANEVIVLGPSLEYTMNLPLLMARAKIVGRTDTSSFVDHKIYEFDQRMNDLLSKQDSPAHYISLIDFICEQGSCEDDEPVLFDANHFTMESALSVAQSIRENLVAHGNHFLGTTS
ncbi:acyltransferase family protein [Hirschia maritima]|uniref:acyltransferase family protein n=1 Tax=Hirschia maritima TaxID=1121961 RepID=UPI00037F9264|nr:acyltransferase family protein [Hirschia maritima]